MYFKYDCTGVDLFEFEGRLMKEGITPDMFDIFRFEGLTWGELNEITNNIITLHKTFMAKRRAECEAN